MAQVDDFTPANVEVDDIFTLTATAEDGTTTAAVNFTATAATVANVCQGVMTAWNNSTNSLHTPITASTDDSTVTLTADVPGVPFYVASTETDGGGTDNQTFTRGATTANAGPMDWNTAANWDGSGGAAVPVTTDKVSINQGSYSIKYGLDQSAVALLSLWVGPNFKGEVGDSVNNYYLQIDVNDGAPNRMNISATSNAVLVKGTIPSVYITRTARTSKAVMLDGDIDNLFVRSRNVAGTITVADSATLDNVYMFGSQSAKLVIGEVTSLDLIETNGGIVELTGACTTITNDGADITIEGDQAVTTITNWRGTVKYNTSGTLTTINNKAGTFTLSESEANAVTITNSTIWDGLIDASSSIANITWSNDTTVHGGDYRVDSGETLTV